MSLYSRLLVLVAVPILVLNFFSNKALGLSLGTLWITICSLQISAHLALMNTKFPANSGLFVRSVINLSNLDLGVKILDLYGNSESDPIFEAAGYDSIHFVDNFSTGFVMVHLYLFTCIVTVGLGILGKRFSPLEGFY